MICKRDLFAKCQSIQGAMYLAKNGKAFKVNETGLKVWELMDGKRTTDQIANMIAAQFDEDPFMVNDDIKKFIDLLIKNGLVSFCQEGPQQE